MTFNSVGPEGRRAGKLHNLSQGLYVLSDGRIVHFTEILVGEEHVFGAEIFDAESYLIAYGPVMDFDEGQAQWVNKSYNVAWKDQDDKFYLLGTQNGSHIVKVVDFEYSIEYE